MVACEIACDDCGEEIDLYADISYTESYGRGNRVHVCADCMEKAINETGCDSCGEEVDPDADGLHIKRYPDGYMTVVCKDCMKKSELKADAHADPR